MKNPPVPLITDPEVQTLSTDAVRVWVPSKCSTVVIVRTAHDLSPDAIAVHEFILAVVREALDKYITKPPPPITVEIAFPPEMPQQEPQR